MVFFKVPETEPLYCLPLWRGRCLLLWRFFCFVPPPPTGFLEGTQVSSRWQEDETQRQPGESLEGTPGSRSSQVLSWSALDKSESPSSICSSLRCLITTRCPCAHCHCHQRELRMVGEQCVKSRNLPIWFFYHMGRIKIRRRNLLDISI